MVKVNELFNTLSVMKATFKAANKWKLIYSLHNEINN